MELCLWSQGGDEFILCGITQYKVSEKHILLDRNRPDTTVLHGLNKVGHHTDCVLYCHVLLSGSTDVTTMGGVCSSPVRRVYGTFAKKTETLDQVTTIDPVTEAERPETIRFVTYTFRGEDGVTYSLWKTFSLDEPDTFQHQLDGRLALYVSTVSNDIHDLLPASNPGLPTTIWRGPDGRLMDNKGYSVCNERKEVSFFARHFNAINGVLIGSSVIAVLFIGLLFGPVQASSASSASFILLMLVYAWFVWNVLNMNR